MQTMTDKDTTYNGWANYDTWNVSLWINNDEGLYREAVRFMRRFTGVDPYTSFARESLLPYSPMTPDGVRWDADTLDTDELGDMMNELVEEG